MDIFSHGLWAGATARSINIKKAKFLNVWRAVFWGVFPDLFAFTIPVVWFLGNMISGGNSVRDLRGMEPAVRDSLPILNLTSTLYNISHSIFVFLAIFLLAWLLFKKPVWELGGWLLHIIIDIPTHSYQFYPTPFLWPVSEWKFDGFSWGEPWFMIINYLALIAVYLWLRKKNRPKS